MAGTTLPPPAAQRPHLSEFVTILAAAFALILTALFFAIIGTGRTIGERDFVSYWATGRLLIQHANPYDRTAVGIIEHAAGLDPRAVLIMRNPPWALPLAYPLGLLPLRLAGILWSLLLLACLLLSVRIIRELYAPPASRLHWLALSFTPAVLCLTMGQTSLLSLLGLVLFLRWHGSRPFLAGAALWLCALKPHLFLPFAAALLLWIVFARAGKVLAGACASLALSSALATLIDPHAWLDYTRLMRSPAVADEFIPCISSALRQWTLPHANWLQYLPAALACIWALAYFWRRRAAWDWKTNASPLILVSLAAAPYCWFYDQCLAIPALLQGLLTTRSRNLVALLALAILAMDIQVCISQVHSPWYLWTAPAWLFWYLLATKRSNTTQPTEAPTS